MTADADVIVVGSGAGGGACAWGLVRRGLKVLLLEAGPTYNPGEDYRLDRPDWELTRFPEKVPTHDRQTVAPLQVLESRWDGLRSWNRHTGRHAGNLRLATGGYVLAVGVGGSTLRFTGEAHRLNPRAMRMRSDYDVAADWPLRYDDLAPYYDLMEVTIGVAGPPTDASRPRRGPYPLPPHPLSHASRRLGDGFRKLGLSWTANPRAALSAAYDDRPACNYCGQCQRGCPRLDKGSVDITLLRHAQASGRLTLLAEAPVLRLEAGPGDRVARVLYRDSRGAQHAATAGAVVLACGAVETPRLLLNSAGSHAPQGLANESGQVGRNFMETLAWLASALHPEPLGSHRGLPADAICWAHNAPDAIPGVVGGCRFGNAVAEADLAGPVNHAVSAGDKLPQ